ncbi:MAG TPA: single-stranded DNA-binding protein [Bacteroidales bacterium]|nr:single-stranded DNA-binding protein [Bacteroidales bacterium]
MAGVNRVILVGHLGKDPEIRTFESTYDPNKPNKVAKFSLATTESYKNKDGQRTDVTEWHNIVVRRGLADVAEKYLRKGQLVYIEGKIKTRSYDKDGQTRYITEIEAENMTMLGGKKEATDVSPDNIPDSAETPQIPAGDDDLPF